MAEAGRVYGYALTIVIAIVLGGFGGVVTWLVTLDVLPTIYMSLGLVLGVFGIGRYQPECAAVGGMLAKTLAWYLAPTLDNLNQFSRYAVSVGLAAFLEYPFLTFANAVSMKNKTAMRLRAIQDAVDISATFIMVALSGIGKVDVFSIIQTLLALLRVVIAVLGPRFCLSTKVRVQDASAGSGVRPADINSRLSVSAKRTHLERIVRLYPKVRGPALTSVSEMWIQSRKEELSKLPVKSIKDRIKESMTKEALLCISLTTFGLLLGIIGFSVETDPYVLGISGVLGMGLAWYVGPSLKDRTFTFRWFVSVVLLSTLEYPFLTEANNRAAEMQETFELRAIQDMVGMIVSTMLISVLSKVALNRVDVFQLGIGFLRVAVVTRFFWTIR